MLKVNEQRSRENLDRISKLVKQAVGDKEYTHLYAYQEKNFIVFKTLTHYAIGFSDKDVIAIPMSAEGEKMDNPQKFKLGEETKVSVSGVVTLVNGSNRLKLQVPGMMPKLMGSKQLEVDQVAAHSDFIQKLKAAK